MSTTPKPKSKTMYYIIGAVLVLLALYFFWYKPKKKKENPNWNLLGSSKPTVNPTDLPLASQTAPIVPDTNVTDTDPTVGTAAAITRMAQLSGVRTLYPQPTNAGYPTLEACKSSGARICEKKADGKFYTWE